MKKYSLILLGALGLMMASCDEDLPVANPQENPQMPELTASDIQIAPQGFLANGGVVNLNDYSDMSQLLPVYTLTQAINLPAGATLSLPLEVSGEAEFETVVTIDPILSGDTYCVTPEQLNDAHIAILGPQDVEKTVYCRIPGYITLNGTVYRFVNNNYYVYEGTYPEICVAGSAFEYLTVPFGVSETQITGGTVNFSSYLRLTTYDYVTYTGALRLDQKWFLSAMPGFEGASFMQAPDTEVVTDEETGISTGQLVRVENYKTGTAMQAPDNGMYWITANVVKLTYELQPINTIQLIGAFNEWNTETAVEMTHLSSGASGVTRWQVLNQEMPAGEYKFCVNRAWTLSFGGSEDDIVQNGGNLNLAEAGVYDFLLDFRTQPATLTVTKK